MYYTHREQRAGEFFFAAPNSKSQQQRWLSQQLIRIEFLFLGGRKKIKCFATLSEMDQNCELFLAIFA